MERKWERQGWIGLITGEEVDDERGWECALCL